MDSQKNGSNKSEVGQDSITVVVVVVVVVVVLLLDAAAATKGVAGKHKAQKQNTHPLTTCAV